MHVKNHLAQLEADAMYKQMFGGEDLEIKRKPLKIKLDTCEHPQIQVFEGDTPPSPI